MLKHKKTICIAFVFFCLMASVGIAKAYSLDEVQFVMPYLETDGILTDVLRGMAQWIYELIGGMLTFCEEGFTALMKWDIMSIPQIQEIITKFDTIVYSILFLIFLGVVVCRMFMMENNLKTLYNVFMTMLVITSFTILLSMIGSARTTFMSEADALLKAETNDTMAETLYKENTVDILRSMEQGSIVRLSDIDGIDLDRVSISLRIDEDVLNEYYTYDENGVPTTEELSDGFFGIGEERYYRYKTDYTSINITILMSIIVYALGIFKGAYLVGQWLYINIFGRVATGKGFWDLSNVGKVLKSALMMVLGSVMLYFSMMLFTVVSSAVMTSTELSNWLVKAIFIFSFGMMVVVGSGFINDFLGIDDGSGFALRSVFMAGRLGRMGRNMARGAGNAVTAPIRYMDKTVGAGSVKASAERNADGVEASNDSGRSFSDTGGNHDRSHQQARAGSQATRSTNTKEEDTRNAQRQERFNNHMKGDYAKMNDLELDGEIERLRQEIGIANGQDASSTSESKRGVDQREAEQKNQARQQRFEEYYAQRYPETTANTSSESVSVGTHADRSTDTGVERGEKKGFTSEKSYRPYEEKTTGYSESNSLQGGKEVRHYEASKATQEKRMNEINASMKQKPQKHYDDGGVDVSELENDAKKKER